MRTHQAFRQRVLLAELSQLLLGIEQRGVRRRREHEKGRTDNRHGHRRAQPSGTSEMPRQSSQRRIGPQNMFDAGHERNEQKRLNARRSELMGDSRQGAAAAERGQRDGEAEQIKEHGMES